MVRVALQIVSFLVHLFGRRHHVHGENAISIRAKDKRPKLALLLYSGDFLYSYIIMLYRYTTESTLKSTRCFL